MKKILKLTSLLLLVVVLFTGCKAGKITNGVMQISDKSWEYIQKNGKIIVGLDASFAPMGFRDETGEIVGFDIDYARAVGKELGVKVEFQPIQWSAKEQELSSKKIDVIWNGMSVTPEREASMLLSKPYLDNALIIMTKKGSSIKKKSDLIGKKIGVQDGSTGLSLIEKDRLKEKLASGIVKYADYDEAIMDLDIGRVEAVVIDKVLAGYKDVKKPNTYGFADEDFGEDVYVVGMRKEDIAFSEKMQEAMDKVAKSSVGSEISKKWFGKDIVGK